MLLIGFSNTRAAIGPLPADLSPLGMRGCWLRVSLDLVVPVSGTPARASLPLPGDPAFAGLPGELDLDGEPRVFGPAVDQGADEDQP